MTTTSAYKTHLAHLAALRVFLADDDHALDAVRVLELHVEILEAKLTNKLLRAQRTAADKLDGTVELHNDRKFAAAADNVVVLRPDETDAADEAAASAKATADRVNAKTARRGKGRKPQKLVVEGIKGKSYTMHGVKREGEVDTDANAEILPGNYIRLYGVDKNRVNGPVSYDKTFRVGDTAEYGSYNLHYLGTITSIGPKTVAIEAHGKTHRLSLAEFSRRNRHFDLEKIQAYNANERMYI